MACYFLSFVYCFVCLFVCLYFHLCYVYSLCLSSFMALTTLTQLNLISIFVVYTTEQQQSINSLPLTKMLQFPRILNSLPSLIFSNKILKSVRKMQKFDTLVNVCGKYQLK